MKSHQRAPLVYFFSILATLFVLNYLDESPSLLAEGDKFYTAGRVSFKVRSIWEEMPVASQMRQFQFRVPRAENDSEDGELAVFYFGPDQGGTVEANIERWAGQFQAPSSKNGEPSKEVKPKVTEKKVNGLDVTVVGIEGTFSGGMGPNVQMSKPDFAFLCAIVKGPRGPVFFKLVGPRRTLQEAQPHFEALIESLKS